MKHFNNQKNSILSTRSIEYIGATSIREALDVQTMPLKSSLIAIVGKKYEKEIMSLFTSVSKIDLKDLTMDKIQAHGFTKATATKVFGAVQFAIGLANTSTNTSFTVKSPTDAATLFMGLQFEKQEHFKVVGFNAKLQVIYEEIIYKGTATGINICVREILQNLLTNKQGIVQFMVGHCHPSGNPLASPEDLAFTEYLFRTAAILDIELVDHIIVGDGQYISMLEQGYFNDFSLD